MEQREDTAPATQVIGDPTTDRLRHALAHSARIHRILDDRPDHPSKAQLEELLANYKTFLASADPEVIAGLQKHVEKLHDMDVHLVAKAVRHLEG